MRTQLEPAYISSRFSYSSKGTSGFGSRNGEHLLRVILIVMCVWPLDFSSYQK